VNVIAAATNHKSTSVMLAALKFFLGQDLAAELDDDEKEADDTTDTLAPTKADVYRTYHKVCSAGKHFRTSAVVPFE
jgi:hypothetical protein